jgi:hypothetical protein
VTSPEQAAQAAQAERRAVNQLAVDRGWCDADGKVIMR